MRNVHSNQKEHFNNNLGEKINGASVTSNNIRKISYNFHNNQFSYNSVRNGWYPSEQPQLQFNGQSQKNNNNFKKIGNQLQIVHNKTISEKEYQIF